jgi:hypothetical protein
MRFHATVGQQPNRNQGGQRKPWSSERRAQRVEHSGTTKTHHTTPVSDTIPHQVTILDPNHPLFQRTLPVLRHTLWRGKPHVVVPLDNGRTRSIPITATEDTPVMPQQEPSVRLPICARMLLPVARRLQAMALTKEEARHDTPTPAMAAQADGHAQRRRQATLEGARSASPHPLHAAPGRPDPTPARRRRQSKEGGGR